MVLATKGYDFVIDHGARCQQKAALRGVSNYSTVNISMSSRKGDGFE